MALLHVSTTVHLREALRAHPDNPKRTYLHRDLANVALLPLLMMRSNTFPVQCFPPIDPTLSLSLRLRAVESLCLTFANRVLDLRDLDDDVSMSCY